MAQFTLNRKNFAVTRVLPKEANNKYAYLHVSSKGTLCLNGFQLARVTLPQTISDIPGEPVLFLPEQLDELRPAAGNKVVKMPEGQPAKSNGARSVPIFDNAIPAPDQMGQSIILDGRALIELLKAACEVTEHSRNLVRLSIAKHGGLLRIDTHRDDGEQEFCGIQVAVQYKGNNIPGLPQAGEEKAAVESVDAKGLALPMNEGRKFRE